MTLNILKIVANIGFMVGSFGMKLKKVKNSPTSQKYQNKLSSKMKIRIYKAKKSIFLR